MKESISEEEEIGIWTCRRRSRVSIMNKEVKEWTSSSKQQQARPKITRTKEEIRLKLMKIMVKIASIEWDDLMLQEQLKSLMCVDYSLRGDPMKDKLIDE